jgi:hypothetical protein
MSLRTAMLKVIDTVTNILGPAVLDQTPSQLTIITRTWTGGAIDADPPAGQPAYTDSSLVITQKYVIREIKVEEVDASGGRYRIGDVMVESLVPGDPNNPGVGYYPTQLEPPIVPGQEVIYQIAGPCNGNYALRQAHTWDTYSYDLVLQPRLDTPTVVKPDAVAGEVD